MRSAVVFCLVWLPAAPLAAAPEFVVRAAPEVWDGRGPARVVVVIGQRKSPEPRWSIGRTGLDAPPILGADATAPGTDGIVAKLGAASAIFPVAKLADVPPGDYVAQAVLRRNYDLNFPNAPGDLSSEPVPFTIAAGESRTVELTLSRAEPAERTPDDSDVVKFLKVPSERLSAFHGRPMFLRAAVVLPPGYDAEPERRYPLRVHIGGYGTRYTSARFAAGRRGNGGPKMLQLFLDGAGPHGDPYQVNSANNGPYGDAVVRDLIPLVESRYRGVGTGAARFTDGHSTGGWVSLALQIFFPDDFNGCWSFCPDPIDFRQFEVIDIYRDANAYVNRHGFERPAKRQTNGDVVYTVRHECQVENVLGLGDNWVTSGKDWGAWNATFGPRGADGRPVPLWEPKTGKINRDVANHWAKYDLRRHLAANWGELGPKLRGKIRVYAGDADDYFLNNAARLFDQFVKKADPPAEARMIFGANAGHEFHPLSDRAMMEEMIAEAERRR